MSPINPQPEARRITSPLERISFIAPLLAGSEEEGTSSGHPGRLVGGLAAVLGCCALATSMSVLGASIMDPSALSASVTELRGSSHHHAHASHAPHHNHHYHQFENLQKKSWNDYTQEMVDYIADRADVGLGRNLFAPLLASTFPHFPEEDHAPLASLLPPDIEHWADVHWTIAYSQFIDYYDRMADFGDNESMLLARFNQYRANAADVYRHNKKSLKFAQREEDVKYLYHLEMNQFGDLDTKELHRLGYVNPDRSRHQKPPKPHNAERALARQVNRQWPWTSVPKEFDWKAEGCVQKVKNQQRCGSCWAFSAVEALESAICVQRKHKKGDLGQSPPGPVSPNEPSDADFNQDWEVSAEMPNLSEQQLVDCGQKDGNHGCHGGMMEFAFSYAMENVNGELCTEDSYDYEGEEGSCRETSCTYEKDWRVSSWNNVTRFSSSGLQKAIYQVGTIAVSVEADNPMFMLYKGGVVHDGEVGKDGAEKSCGTRLNHGVAAVGWGVDEETEEPYWLVKNSWGPQWGEDGFIRLARDSGGMFGECGILMDASFPIIEFN